MPLYSTETIIDTAQRLRHLLATALGLWPLLSFLMTMVAELWSDVMDSEPSTTMITPADYIDFYGDPFNLVSTLSQRPWKGKGKLIPRKAVPATPVQPEDAVDWAAREPPEALGLAPSIEDEVLLRVIASSIDRVKSRVTEEANVKRQQSVVRRQRQEEEEAAKAQQEPKPEDAGPYLPIIMPEERPETDTDSYIPNRVFLKPNGEGSSTGAGLVIFPPIKPKKPSRFKISRFLRRRENKTADASLSTAPSQHTKSSTSLGLRRSTESTTRSQPEPIPQL